MFVRRTLAFLAATVVFALVICATVVAAPYALGLLYRCVPPTGSCGDGVGWAMIISSPVSIPLTLLLAGALATAIYLRIMRA